VRGPNGPRTPYPANDPGIIDLPGSDPDVIPGAPQRPPGTMSRATRVARWFAIA
jgi:hypothetical protein